MCSAPGRAEHQEREKIPPEKLSILCRLKNYGTRVVYLKILHGLDSFETTTLRYNLIKTKTNNTLNFTPMKKTILIAIFALVSAMSITSCTEETVAPTKHQDSMPAGGVSDPIK